MPGRGGPHVLLSLFLVGHLSVVTPAHGAGGLLHRAEHVARPVVLACLYVRFQTLSSLFQVRADGDVIFAGVRGVGRGGQHRPGVGDGQGRGVSVVLWEGEGGAVEFFINKELFVIARQA